MANQPIRAPLDQAIPPVPASLLEIPRPSQAPSEGACADSEEPGIYPEDPSPADETGNTDANGSPDARAALARIRARERMHVLAWYRVQRAEVALDSAQHEGEAQAKALEEAEQALLERRAQGPAGAQALHLE